jgi:ComF family protein
MASWWQGWLDLLAPPLCAGCGDTVGRDVALCVRCTRSLTAAGPVSPRPERLDACVAAVDYSGAAEEWIRRFKYPRRGLAGLDPAALAVARSLARRAAARAPDRSDLVVPVPLHPRRLRARGFNPACELARDVARAARIPLAPTALVRLRDTPSQTGLDRPARARNVRDAFVARVPIPSRVWLVDDVVTTGATLSEAARALRRAGARHITAVCAARTP